MTCPATSAEQPRRPSLVGGLASYKFRRFKTKPPKTGKAAQKPASLTFLVKDDDVAAARAGARAGEAIAAGVLSARDAGNTPGNHMTPSVLARTAQSMARQQGLKARVLTEKHMSELGMGSLLSVSRGSAEPAKMIILEHGKAKKGQQTICLVGKGLTFDTRWHLHQAVARPGQDALRHVRRRRRPRHHGNRRAPETARYTWSASSRPARTCPDLRQPSLATS